MMPKSFWYWLWAAQAFSVGIISLVAFQVGAHVIPTWLGGLIVFGVAFTLWVFEEDYRGLGR